MPGNWRLKFDQRASWRAVTQPRRLVPIAVTQGNEVVCTRGQDKRSYLSSNCPPKSSRYAPRRAQVPQLAPAKQAMSNWTYISRPPEILTHETLPFALAYQVPAWLLGLLLRRLIPHPAIRALFVLPGTFIHELLHLMVGLVLNGKPVTISL